MRGFGPPDFTGVLNDAREIFAADLNRVFHLEPSRRQRDFWKASIDVHHAQSYWASSRGASSCHALHTAAAKTLCTPGQTLVRRRPALQHAILFTTCFSALGLLANREST